MIMAVLSPVLTVFKWTVHENSQTKQRCVTCGKCQHCFQSPECLQSAAAEVKIPPHCASHGEFLIRVSLHCNHRAFSSLCMPQSKYVHIRQLAPQLILKYEAQALFFGSAARRR